MCTTVTSQFFLSISLSLSPVLLVTKRKVVYRLLSFKRLSGAFSWFNFTFVSSVIPAYLVKLDYCVCPHHGHALLGQSPLCRQIIETCNQNITMYVTPCFIFTTLYGMQTLSSDENSIRLSVRQMRAL